jgi:DNA-binding MarR family transcriptional regulator
MAGRAIDDRLVDEILGQMGRFMHAVKASAAGICAQLPVEAADGELRALSYAQYRVIVHLAKFGQSPVGEIAQGIGVTIATASQLIDKLVDEGWLERGVNPEDRRQVLIRLTPRSEQIAARIHELRRAQVRRALERLDAADAAAAARVFRAFVETFGSEAAPEAAGGVGRAPG